eukprot:CAMPEP_0115600996 /NCGR_PEP_ID=MMETSP0272-20121206/15174_1 /TAXON_ID=71861 /ORGANISM="Scrippsiella trochoidea, Strain CCMP3099" /LENGTH=71 /DNA_ID=CAMNT_0003036453 /DNA_START=50 /DNA_END=262 /DNA_ORIENTATION=-
MTIIPMAVSMLVFPTLKVLKSMSMLGSWPMPTPAAAASRIQKVRNRSKPNFGSMAAALLMPAGGQHWKSDP